MGCPQNIARSLECPLNATTLWTDAGNTFEVWREHVVPLLLQLATSMDRTVSETALAALTQLPSAVWTDPVCGTPSWKIPLRNALATYCEGQLMKGEPCDWATICLVSLAP